MSTYIPASSDYLTTEISGKTKKLLSRERFETFSPSLLGLGPLSHAATSTDAMAAVFDLSGFTNFCKQIEPHLTVPLFLSEFLNWLMDQLKKMATKEEHAEGVTLWNPLPFFVKFMGDGLLVLWDASTMGASGRRNVIVSGMQICQEYANDFVPTVRSKVVDPPLILRCGLARGTVYSVGDGNDYVGSCINMAARLQKLPGVTFGFNRRGIDLEDPARNDFFKNEIVVKQVSIRGIGENELIALLKTEFEVLKSEDKRIFRDV